MKHKAYFKRLKRSEDGRLRLCVSRCVGSPPRRRIAPPTVAASLGSPVTAALTRRRPAVLPRGPDHRRPGRLRSC